MIKNGFIERFKISLLNFSFVTIYIIHKKSVLLKNHLNFLNVLRSITDFQCFSKNLSLSLSPGEENITKNIRNLFRPKNKELNYTAITNIRNLFRQKKEINVIKDGILRYIKNLFEHEEEEENSYKPVKVSTFWRNNYIAYESNDDSNKTLSVEEYLNKIRPYLKDIINNLKNLTHEKFN